MFGKKKVEEIKEQATMEEPIKQDHIQYFLQKYSKSFGVEDTGSVIDALKCSLLFAIFCEIRELKE